MPEVDELEMLKSFDGDKSKLGNAEKFFLQLVQVPKYDTILFPIPLNSISFE